MRDIIDRTIKPNEELIPLRMPKVDGKEWYVYLEVRRNRKTISLHWDYEHAETRAMYHERHPYGPQCSRKIDYGKMKRLLKEASREWEVEMAKWMREWLSDQHLGMAPIARATYGSVTRASQEFAEWIIQTLPAIYEAASKEYEELGRSNETTRLSQNQ